LRKNPNTIVEATINKNLQVMAAIGVPVATKH
jgi:hypothetical protein